MTPNDKRIQEASYLHYSESRPMLSGYRNVDPKIWELKGKLGKLDYSAPSDSILEKLYKKQIQLIEDGHAVDVRFYCGLCDFALLFTLLGLTNYINCINDLRSI